MLRLPNIPRLCSFFAYLLGFWSLESRGLEVSRNDENDQKRPKTKLEKNRKYRKTCENRANVWALMGFPRPFRGLMGPGPFWFALGPGPLGPYRAGPKRGPIGSPGVPMGEGLQFSVSGGFFRAKGTQQPNSSCPKDPIKWSQIVFSRSQGPQGAQRYILYI